MKINSTIFREYDVRGKYPSEINGKSAYAVGLAFVKIYKIKRLALGRDARKESESLFWPLVAGLAKGGVKISDLGVCATPELFFAVGAKKFDGGIMVTASHSPVGETGIKFCDGKGRAIGLGNGLIKIRERAEKIAVPSRINGLKPAGVDFISIVPEYLEFLKKIVKPENVKGIKLIVDASGGSAARVAEAALNHYPILVRKINFRSGDAYADHGPNPLIKNNRAAVSKAIRETKVDFGVMFDGDGDRAIFFDEWGEFIEPYWISCLLTQNFLKLYGRQTVIVDARLGLMIGEIIKMSGGRALVHRSGYANIIKTMQARRIKFACENSGHFMYNFSLADVLPTSFKRRLSKNYAYGDGILPILLMAQYLKASGIKLSRAVDFLKKQYQISGEQNYPVKDFNTALKNIARHFKSERFSHVDGLSIYGADNDWFFNIRSSHTEPLIRLNIEARTEKQVKEIKNSIEKLLK